MYFPDPTQKPTVKDYDWAREIKADDFSLRIDWVLRQAAIRDVSEGEFCERAGVNRFYIQHLRTRKRAKPLTEPWIRFVNYLEARAAHIPDCLWRRQHLFPYHKEYLPEIFKDMNIAGFTPYTLQHARGTYCNDSILGRAKRLDGSQWLESLSLIYAVLDGLPELPVEVIAKYFPYDPLNNPEDAKSKMELLWRQQEMTDSDEQKLSIALRHNVNAATGQCFLRSMKLTRKPLSVLDYAKLVHILHQPTHIGEAVKLDESFRQYFPFSEQARKNLALCVERLGITYNAIHAAGQERFGVNDSFGSTYPKAVLSGEIKTPSQDIWRKIVLAVQDVTTNLRQDFIKAWNNLYGEKGNYKEPVNQSSAEHVFQIILSQGDTFKPLPIKWLAPSLVAGITWGRRFGKAFKPLEVGKYHSDSWVVDVISIVDVKSPDQFVIQLHPGTKLVIHTREGYQHPIAIMDDMRELREHGVRLFNGSSGYSRKSPRITPLTRFGNKPGKTPVSPP